MISYTSFSSYHSVQSFSTRSATAPMDGKAPIQDGAAPGSQARSSMAAQANPSQSHGQSHSHSHSHFVSRSYQSHHSASFSSPTYAKPTTNPEPTQASAEQVDTQALAEVSEKPAKNQYANNILSFINAQLQRDVADGATEEELASRLKAGLDGFKSGYGDALDQLKSAGFLSEEIEADIQTTYDQVLQGIDELAEELGIESPVERSASEPESPAAEASESAPVVAPVTPSREDRLEAVKNELTKPIQNLRILESFRETQEKILINQRADSTADKGISGSKHELAESRKFSFSLTTADGDKVTIKAFAMQAQSASYSQYSGEQGSGSVSRYAQSNHERFAFSVEGELDEGELKAINELLGKVNDVAEMFFSGDVEAAFNNAKNMGFDSEEISQFALNLKMASVERVQNTYQPISEDKYKGESFNGMPKLASFVQNIHEAGRFAESMGHQKRLVADLAKFVASNVHANQESAPRFGPFVSRFL